MSTPILATKLYIPPPRAKIVLRPRLIERLNKGLSSGRKLIITSASAGFGKTTLVSEWVVVCGRTVAWLSLDEGDNDPVRFIAYLVAALQTIKAGIGEGLLAALQSSPPPSIESILTTLLNEITAISGNFILVLDDYHIIDSKPVDEAITLYKIVFETGVSDDTCASQRSLTAEEPEQFGLLAGSVLPITSSKVC